MEEKKVIDPTFLVAPGGTEHYANFIDAIRSGKNETLNCDIKEGYYSSALPIMANISYRLGRVLTFDGNREKFVDDDQANQMITRDYRKPYVVPSVV